MMRVLVRSVFGLALAAPLELLAQTNPALPVMPDDEIDDIRPPYFFYHSATGLWWLLGLLVLAVLLVLLVLWLRPRRQLSAKSAYDLALEKLEHARGLLREDSALPYAVTVSETVRSYLGQRFHSPSTRRTTEEFLRQMEMDGTAPLAPHRTLLGNFLQACDLVKFGKYQPRLSELEEVQQRATQFVLATRPESNGKHAA